MQQQQRQADGTYSFLRSYEWRMSSESRGVSTNVSSLSPMFPTASITNLIALVCMVESPCLVVSSTDRRLSTRREIMIDVISWLNCAPTTLRSSSASCNNFQ